jgi:hypothetical protein
MVGCKTKGTARPPGKKLSFFFEFLRKKSSKKTSQRTNFSPTDKYFE